MLSTRDKQILLDAVVHRRSTILSSLLPFSGSSGAEGYCGVYKNHFVVLFRQTDEIKDWITNLLFCTKTMPYARSKKSKVRIHGGFVSAYLDLAVRGKIQAEYVKSGSSLPVFVGGYSQGGALACICALDLQYNYELDVDRIQAVVLNSPRVFNSVGETSYNRRVPDTTRLFYGNDFVSLLPPKLLGFRHVGVEVHVGPRRWFPNFADHTKVDELIVRIEE